MKYLNILLIIVLFSACSKAPVISEPCDDVLLGNQLVSDFTKEFNNYNNIERVIFKNEAGEEVILSPVSTRDTLIEFYEWETCNGERKEFLFHREVRETHLSSADEKYTLVLSLLVDFNRDERTFIEERIAEFVNYRLMRTVEGLTTLGLFKVMVYNASGAIDVDQLNFNTNETQLLDEYVIGGKTFENVYDRGTWLKFNREVGLVSFTEEDETFVFDRFE